MSERFGSRYVLEEVVGRGGMGRVHRARREPDGALVAIKVLREDLADQPDIVGRFVNEREILRSIDHPHVVRVRDLIVDDGRLGIVMDFFEAGHLRRTVPPPVAPAVAVTLMAQIADGLAAVHAAGVVHRDLKPENVLARPGDDGFQLQLTDFGISRLMGASTTRLTSMIGTPGYMAPEVGLGERVTGAVDVYALGVMLYEWCTGRPPFQADNAIALIRAHAQDPVPRPTGMPPSVLDLLDRLLAKRPEDRPTADVVARELRRLAPTLTGIEAFDIDEHATIVNLAAAPVEPLSTPATVPGLHPVANGAATTVLSPAPPRGGTGGPALPEPPTILRPPPNPNGGNVIPPPPLTPPPPLGLRDDPAPKRPSRALLAAGAALATVVVAAGAVAATRAFSDPAPTAEARSTTPSATQDVLAPPSSASTEGTTPSTAPGSPGARSADASGAGARAVPGPAAPNNAGPGAAPSPGRTRAAATPTVRQAPAEPVTVARPGAVASMSLSNPTSTTLNLSWGAATGATSYRLGWTESGADGRTWSSDDIEYGADRRGVTLINLRPGRTYSVSVTPINAAGAGPTSKRAMDTLGAAAPPSAVSSMSLSNPTTTTLQLSWGGASGATSYRLAWTESGADGRTWQSDDTEYGAGRRGVTLINLRPGRTYTVSVTPLNAEGSGPTTTRSASTSG